MKKPLRQDLSAPQFCAKKHAFRRYAKSRSHAWACFFFFSLFLWEHVFYLLFFGKLYVCCAQILLNYFSVVCTVHSLHKG